MSNGGMVNDDRRFEELSKCDPNNISQEDRTELLNLCAKRVDKYHHECEIASAKTLAHAYDAGCSLEMARKFLLRRGEWGKWLDFHFRGSIETVNLYRRIYRHWNDPDIRNARYTKGIKSIRQFMKILRRKPEIVEEEEECYLDRCDKKIAESFASHLRQLSEEHIKQLAEWTGTSLILNDSDCDDENEFWDDRPYFLSPWAILLRPALNGSDHHQLATELGMIEEGSVYKPIQRE